ncbi:MAG: cytochrome c5 family protein [Nitrospirae bacterium]|nr:cytochrome c5 family protein [Nitrospirota bacterium]
MKGVARGLGTTVVCSFLTVFVVLCFVGASFGADGKAVYEKTCSACHKTGLLSAPKFGDENAWKSRIAKNGKKVLYKHAIEGHDQMPARGGDAKLTDEEVKSAVDYMAGKAGK